MSSPRSLIRRFKWNFGHSKAHIIFIPDSSMAERVGIRVCCDEMRGSRQAQQSAGVWADVRLRQIRMRERAVAREDKAALQLRAGVFWRRELIENGLRGECTAERVSRHKREHKDNQTHTCVMRPMCFMLDVRTRPAGEVWRRARKKRVANEKMKSSDVR